MTFLRPIPPGGSHERYCLKLCRGLGLKNVSMYVNEARLYVYFK